MYKILHIPTGQYVVYFNVQKLCGTKEYPKATWGSHYRKPPYFYLIDSSHYNFDDYTPDWVINSILRRKKMYKRLIQVHNYDTENNFTLLSEIIEAFEFIKIEE